MFWVGPGPAYHLSSCSGSVQARKTSSRGAFRCRTTVKPRSVVVATLMVHAPSRYRAPAWAGAWLHHAAPNGEQADDGRRRSRGAFGTGRWLTQVILLLLVVLHGFQVRFEAVEPVLEERAI